MSPPHCHYGSSDNGTPMFGNTSSSITPAPRHYIFKPRGAGTEALLALWDRCRRAVVILVTAACQWRCCAVWLHFHSVQHYKYIDGAVRCTAGNSPSYIWIYCYSAWCSLAEHCDGIVFCMSSLCLPSVSATLSQRCFSTQQYEDQNKKHAFCLSSVLNHNLAANSSSGKHLAKSQFKMWVDGEQFGGQSIIVRLSTTRDRTIRAKDMLNIVPRRSHLSQCNFS